ncbi:MAG: penicillin-binding transpeptidase domain-containing protein [Hespellia sp.]|nr:penicillin-binding transpeptidase domain-containing protein [Hespellia sp.]
MARRYKKNRFQFLKRKFPKRMQKKLAMVFTAIVLAFVVLIGRITYINASKGDKYTKIVLEQQQYDSQTIPYKRGDIIDRNGTKVATSERVYNVILDAKLLMDDKKYLTPTLKVLKDCFGIEETDVQTILTDSPTSRYTILKKGVDYDTAKKFKEIDADDENYPDIAGIWLEDDYSRTYPYNSLASDLIGFTASGNVGTAGIEAAYNSVLNGTDGREYGYLTEDSSLERTVKEATDGYNVVTTIDVTLQSIVEQCIKEFNDEHANTARAGEPGSKNTGVIIMNPNTGEILAEASYPNFDLNNPRELTTAYSAEAIAAMSDEQKLEALNALWRNFCVSDAYEPGSTVKPFTIAAALETGAINGSETYNCSGALHVGDYDIHCHLRSGHGTETVEEAVANSCNVALMEIAEVIGVENFTKYQHIFGFGEYTGIDLPGEASTSSLLYSADSMGITDLATNSFGQNFNVTMTQLVTGFSSLINGGNYYEPHVVKQIQDQNGNVIETKTPTLLKKTISEETSTLLKQYMKAVVDYGTGTECQVEGYDIGGKTGTAEKLPRGEGNYLLSFVGYAPQENPEVVVYVVIDEANSDNQSNSALVAGLSQKIMAQAFPYLNITTVEGYDPVAAAAAAKEAAQEEAATEEYTSYDEEYDDNYNNEDGYYGDENYDPDYTDWVTDDSQDESAE